MSARRGVGFFLLTCLFAGSIAAAAVFSVLPVGMAVRIAAFVAAAAATALWLAAYLRRMRDCAAGAAASPPDAARTRFMIMHVVLALVFVVAMAGGVALLSRAESLPMRIVATAAPTAVLCVWAWEFARMIRRADEMMQAAHLRAVAVAAGLVLFAATLWGLFERMLGMPAWPPVYLLPAFAVAYSISISVQGVRE